MTGERVRKVSMVSTGTVDIHHEHAYGSKAPMFWWIMTGRRWLNGRPINVIVIDHADGLVLFDAGQDLASVTDPDYYPGGFLRMFYRRLARFHMEPADALETRLADIGYRLADVRTVVVSHLHQDHVGALASLTHADIVATPTEHKSLTGLWPEACGVMRDHIDLPGLKWRDAEFTPVADPELAPFTEAHDLMGDGSLMVLRTPGHTKGSLSMLVRRPEHPLLLVGDLTFSVELMEQGKVPGVGDAGDLKASSAKVLAMARRRPDLAVIAAHDPGAADRLRAAGA